MPASAESSADGLDELSGWVSFIFSQWFKEWVNVHGAMRPRKREIGYLLRAQAQSPQLRRFERIRAKRSRDDYNASRVSMKFGLVSPRSRGPGFDGLAGSTGEMVPVTRMGRGSMRGGEERGTKSRPERNGCWCGIPRKLR